jgi:hypothetical protein
VLRQVEKSSGVEAGCKEVLRLATKRVDVEVGCKEAGMLGRLLHCMLR